MPPTIYFKTAILFASSSRRRRRRNGKNCYNETRYMRLCVNTKTYVSCSSGRDGCHPPSILKRQLCLRHRRVIVASSSRRRRN